MTAVGSSNTILVFTILFGSFLLGHIVQWLRGRFGRQPGEFQRRMEDVREGNERNDIHKKFLEQTNGYFEISDDFDDLERFRLVLSYLETRPPVRALRFQSIYSFYRSLVVAALFGFGLSVLGAILYLTPAIFPIRGIGYILFNSVATGLVAYTSWKRRNKFEDIFVGYAVREFYADQIAEESENPT